MMIVCPEGHGRVLHVGHMACATCGHIKKRASDTPAVCCATSTSAAVDPVSGWEPACAQCYAAQQLGGAATHVEEYDEGHAGITFT
jgi:hypothetical protein